MTSFEQAIAADFPDVVDGLTTVTLAAPPAQPLTVPRALGRQVTLREAEASGGRVQQGDRYWHLPTAVVTTQPPLGSVIQHGDAQWTVLGVQLQTLTRRWRCHCRELAIASGLDTRVTLQQATFVKAPGGAAEPTWSTLVANLRAKLQIITSENDPDFQLQANLTRARLIVERDVPFEAGLVPSRRYRVLDQQQRAWSILRYEQSGRPDVLPVLVIEHGPWPRS